MKRILFVIFLLWGALTVKAASAPDFNFIHYTTDNGLPSNSIRDIAQDDEGYVWFATDGGLVRFDGAGSKVFVPEGADGNPDFFILSLCRRRGGILAGSDRCLYSYDSRSEKLRPLRLTYPRGMKERAEGAVLAICSDSSGDVWVSVEQKGVFRISEKGEVLQFQSFPTLDDFVGGLYVDPSDMVWALSTTGAGGVYRYDRSRGRFERFRIRIDGREADLPAMAMTCDMHGDYWVGTWESGVVRFNGRTGDGERVAGAADAPKVWHIHSVTEYSPTMLFIGSDSGLTLMDRNSGECRVYQSDELNQQSLTDRFIYPVVRDTDGGFWIGTYYRGVNYLSPDSKRFQRWHHSRFANSVSGNVVSRFCEDGEGNIWIGTADGGLCRYNPDNGLFSHFPLVASEENDNINALAADGDKLWVGTYSKGAGLLDTRTGEWRRVSVEGRYNYSTYAICKDSEGNVWMGVNEKIARLDKEKGMFREVWNLGAWITDIDEDRDGSLWISTQGRGLVRIDPVSGEKRVYLTSKTPGSLPHNHVNSVTVGPGGEVYVATLYGVCRYDRTTGCFEEVTGGAHNVAAQAIQAAGTDLWISTLSGLLRLGSDGQSRMFTYADGISDNQFLPGASFQASDGMIYYGTVHGFCRVAPMEARGQQRAPRLKFTGLDVVDRPVEPGDPRLAESLNSVDRLLLTHADHTFTIYFSALGYSNPSATKYMYRLEGFDKSWHETGRENRASYSNLPPGDYTLRVKAASGDGVWNEEGISLRITVKPAWYVSAWMKALYVLAFVALLLFGVKLVLRRMERNHAVELDRISSNKEKEMFRSKLSFFTVVAHEIRTPVSLIIGPLEKILDSGEIFSPSVKEDLTVIDRNSKRLLSLVNQLLDFKKVEDNALPVGFRSENIVPLIENVTDRFRPSLAQKGIALSVDCRGMEGMSADVDPEALTKLVSNLLNNARKFTKSAIRVECRMMPGGERFMISVEDDGIGITKENRDKIFKPFFQVLDSVNEARGGTGLGLSIVKSVADAHGGEIQLESTPGKGSKFIALLPVRHDNVVPAEEAVPAQEPEDEPEVCEKREGARPVLLVVDDNEEMARFVASSFEKQYDVVTASNGEEALDALAADNVSLIICDWMMPLMDGVEFLKRVRGNGNWCHIPFVMLTAKTDNLSKVETMKNGADLYIEKPFSINYLEACIDNLLEMRAVLRKKYSDEPLEPITALASSETDNDLLMRLQTLIEENFSNPELNVDFLADRLGISRSGLYTKIRNLADVTPKELIQITRLKKGAELLKEGKYRINEISYMVGFGSASYFSKCFFRQFGVRPGDFAGNT